MEREKALEIIKALEAELKQCDKSIDIRLVAKALTKLKKLLKES